MSPVSFGGVVRGLVKESALGEGGALRGQGARPRGGRTATAKNCPGGLGPEAGGGWQRPGASDCGCRTSLEGGGGRGAGE